MQQSNNPGKGKGGGRRDGSTPRAAAPQGAAQPPPQRTHQLSQGEKRPPARAHTTASEGGSPAAKQNAPARPAAVGHPTQLFGPAPDSAMLDLPQQTSFTHVGPMASLSEALLQPAAPYSEQSSPGHVSSIDGSQVRLAEPPPPYTSHTRTAQTTYNHTTHGTHSDMND